MERDPVQATAERFPDFSIRQRLLNSRAGMLVTAAVTSLGIISMAETVDAEPASLQQSCVDAALKMPKTEHAYMAHPGKKLYFTKDGAAHAQGSYVLVTYPEVIPPGGQAGVCDEEVLRVERGEEQKKIGDKWRKIPDASWKHYSNEANSQRIRHADGQHGEPEWMYWHKGDHFRIFMWNIVKDPATHKTLATSHKAIPVQIRR